MVETETKNKSHKKTIMIIAVAALIIIAVASGLIAYNNSPSVRLRKQLNLGNKYLAELNYEQAIAEFNKALEIAPDDETVVTGLVNAYTGWSASYSSAGDHARSMEILHEANTRLPGNSVINETIILAYLEWADSLTANGDYASAIEILQQGYDESGDERLFTRISEIQLDMEKAKLRENGFELGIDDEITNKLLSLYSSEDYEGIYSYVMDSAEIRVIQANNKGKTCYSGDIKNDYPDGLGVIIYGRDVKEATLVYVGDISHGLRNGRGIAVWKRNDNWKGYYIGEWENDIQNGEACEMTYDPVFVTKYEGQSVNGIAEGSLDQIRIDERLNSTDDGVIIGYEFYCENGIPVPIGYGSIGHISENYICKAISPTGRRLPCYHKWCGYRCVKCGDGTAQGLDFLNNFDHQWAGWGDYAPEFTFLNAD